MNTNQIMIYVAPLCMLAMWIEFRYSKKINLRVYLKRDFITNIKLGILNVVIGSISSVYMLMLSFYVFTQFESFRVDVFNYHQIGWGLGAWTLAILADDFTFYWFHRGGHMVRVMWAAHVVHHASEHFNFSTAVRLAWMKVLCKPIIWLWMPAIGFHPTMVVVCVGISSLYQFFLHTQFAAFWNKFSWILCTPGLHAVHHGKDDRCIDKNFSGIFILFDKIFGTYAHYTSLDEIHFGVTFPPVNESAWEVSTYEFRSLFHDLKKSRSWSERLQYIIRAPGWKPAETIDNMISTVHHEKYFEIT